MFTAVASPLVKIQGRNIREAIDGEVSPLATAPQKSTPAASLTSSTSSSSWLDKPCIASSVLLPKKAQYTPKSTRPNFISPDQPHQHHTQTPTSDPRWRKQILHRFITPTGAIVFNLGTRFGGTTTRDNGDIPLSQIFSFITPDELRRFENQDYADEHERERERLLTLKPRGRPRKYALPEGASLSGEVSELPRKEGTTTSSHSYARQGYAAFNAAVADGEIRKKRGRPKGWKKNPGPALGLGVPSFNGPQPTGDEPSAIDSSTREQSLELETPLEVQARTGVYSMVAASGLVPGDFDTEEEFSRGVTPLPAIGEEIDKPDVKRRRIDNHTIIPDTQFSNGRDSNILELSQLSTGSEVGMNRMAILTEIEDSDAERQALLEQFATKDDQRRQSSVSSNDSLLSRIVCKPKPRPTQYVAAPQPKTITPLKTAPRRRTSLTPHFPSSGFRIPKLDGKEGHVFSGGPTSPVTVRKWRPQQDAPIPATHDSSKRYKQSSPVKISPSQPSTASSIGSLGTKQKDTYKDITAYFSPRPKPSKSDPRQQIVRSTTRPPGNPASSTSASFSANNALKEDSSNSNKSESENALTRPTSSMVAHDSRASSYPSSSALKSNNTSSFMPVTQPSDISASHNIGLADSIDPRLRNGVYKAKEDSSDNESEEEDESEIVNLPEMPVQYLGIGNQEDRESGDSDDSDGVLLKTPMFAHNK